MLWDRDPEHPMKVGLSGCPRRRMLGIKKAVPWPIEIVLVVPLDLEVEFWQRFEGFDLPYEMKHGGWTEWYLDPALVELVEDYGATSSPRVSAMRVATVASGSSWPAQVIDTRCSIG